MTEQSLTNFEPLQRHLLKTLPPASQYIVAFSGGMDSQVLLHALAAIRTELAAPIHAVHVHHGLQDSADEWALFCEQSATALDVGYTRLRVSVDANHPDGLEAAARHARYQALADWLPHAAILLTAHHQRDQAETLLLQLLRGAGPRGLSAMPTEKSFGNGTLLRPLLDMPYAHLQAYAEQFELDWVDDPSNDNPRFDRNLLRHSLMPLMRERWQGLDQVLARVSRHQTSATRLMDDMARIDLKGARGASPNTLSVHALLGLPPYRRDNLLRFWFHSRGMRLPSEAVMQRLTPELLEAREDAMPIVEWDGAELRRFQDDVYLLPVLDAVPHGWQQPLPEKSMPLPAGGSISVESDCGKGIDAQLLAQGSWHIRYRQGGERIKPAGHPHTRTLKQLLQENAVPPWVRERMPLVYCQDQLVAVAQLWVAEGFQAARGKPGMLYKFDLLG